MNDITAEADAAVSVVRPAAPARPGLYILIVVFAVLAASYYRLRADSVFGCQATGYSADDYLSYCQTEGYGDFEHGAIWFNLEPVATHAASTADVLFVGNSRMEYGFSTDASKEWLAMHAPSYFLLGFAYHPRVLFEAAVLRKLQPRARVFVINVDTFFQENASIPARAVMDEPDARSRYQRKQLWQTLHRSVCGRLAFLCGDSYAIFKNRHTGMWHGAGLISANEVTSVADQTDPAEVAGEIASGHRFLDSLGVDRNCVIFTLVPTVDAPRAGTAQIAAALNVNFIAPDLEDLLTFDGSHLDRQSAERWSGAFFDAAGAQIRQCLAADRPPSSAAAR
jgi:hypothetical protein